MDDIMFYSALFYVAVYWVIFVVTLYCLVVKRSPQARNNVPWLALGGFCASLWCLGPVDPIALILGFGGSVAILLFTMPRDKQKKYKESEEKR